MDLERWTGDYKLGNFMLFSDDIILHILEYLEPKELANSMLINKNFNRIAGDKVVDSYLFLF